MKILVVGPNKKPLTRLKGCIETFFLCPECDTKRRVIILTIYGQDIPVNTQDEGVPTLANVILECGHELHAQVI